ncbi:hypothetical protein [Olivibacter jilunii]|uniref:hypothetical protein n=1 Tax=Olivibacter jilunii TaxID=985016 RepID=UPI001030C9FB|nr:hypothetical protein [Olivibacter jilunii]
MNLTFIMALLCPYHKNIHQLNDLFHVTAKAKQAQLRHKNEPAANAVFIIYRNNLHAKGKGDRKP